jgi:hypothetical protein
MLPPQMPEFQRVCSELKLTLPTNNMVGVDAPSSKTYWYHEDCKHYDRLGLKRCLFIRGAFETEFDPKGDFPLPALFPSLWVLVRRNDGAVHFRHAFWRGDRPFSSEPPSDTAIDNVYAECTLKGGIDGQAVQRWLNSRN